ncbi:MAG: hypothetical protein HYS40_03475 [Gemmatimonadetes bacterium]|nr:hypothetical protein [Gemmatimonadota bacterium]
MRPRAVALALTLAVAPPGAAAAQGLTATELGAGAQAAFARREFAGGGLAVARRISSQTRLALGAAGGTLAQRAAVRLEATAQFLVTPAGRSGAGLYGGAGLAFQGAGRTPGAGYLVVLLGLERAPGRRAGWFTELGLGGGVRVAAGWRWRWFPAWWR